jgi:hypothetical protein
MLVFEITAIPEADWNVLKTEWESPNGHTNPGFDLAAHLNDGRNERAHFDARFGSTFTSFDGK